MFQALSFAETVMQWPQLRPLLEQAVASARGEITVDDVLDLVAKDRMRVSVLRDEADAIELAIATEIITYPRMRVLNIAFAGGRGAKEVVDRHIAELEALAREAGADRLRCFCRPSVARLLKRIAPRTVDAYTVLEREIAA